MLKREDDTYIINGILNILKPSGMTSFDVVSYLRNVLKEKKIGHAGTLDPGAAGVLPICIGKATKSVEYIMDMDKEYRTELTLGVSTDTQDFFGDIISESNVSVSKEEISYIIKKFVGITYQIPPMHSALKVEGKRLYDLARQGKSIKREPRKVTIYSIDIIDIDIKKSKILFDVVCSRGTYIRTLCADIGEALNCGGHMSFLIRKRNGVFSIDSAIILEDILKARDEGGINKVIIKTDKVFGEYRRISVGSKYEKIIKNGGYIPFDGINFFNNNIPTFPCPQKPFMRIYNKDDEFLALGRIIDFHGVPHLKPEKMFI